MSSVFAKFERIAGIEILMMVGYGDKTRTQAEVCELFNEKYPERHITRSVVSEIEKRDLDHVRNSYKANRFTALENTQLNVLLNLQENPHKANLLF